MNHPIQRFSACALLLVLAAACIQGDEPNKLQALMRKKLEHSQKILEGIAVDDCNMIIKHAEDLIDISKDAEWRVVKTPQYEVHSNEFRRTAQTMVQKAREKNIDGATLAYMDMTMNCVKCHKYVREVRMTRTDSPESSSLLTSR